MADQPVSVGRIVHYQTDERNGLRYVLPAVITVTQDSHPGDYPSGDANPLPVPDSESHVHLTVLSPGGFGSSIGADAGEEWKGAPGFTPGSGTYVEWNVPFSAEGASRSWHWPPRV